MVKWWFPEWGTSSSHPAMGIFHGNKPSSEPGVPPMTLETSKCPPPPLKETNLILGLLSPSSGPLTLEAVENR